MSAVSASPTVSGSAPADPVRALQHALYRAAKADPGRRFDALRDEICRRDVLWRGWVAVRSNNGAPGVDKTTLDQIEQQYGIVRLLDELALELRNGSYRPLPTRRVVIAKPGTTSSARCRFPLLETGLCRCVQDRARADLRGRLHAVLVRVPPEASCARRSTGSRRPGLARSPVGG